MLDQLPEHLKKLGAILRRSVETDSLEEFKSFLQEQELQAPEDRLEDLRDTLIVGRVDLMDLVDDARKRLRAKTLQREPPSAMTDDYRAAIGAGRQPQCRDCRYFVKAPLDEGPHADKACVEFGTKGADAACFGFTR